MHINPNSLLKNLNIISRFYYHINTNNISKTNKSFFTTSTTNRMHNHRGKFIVLQGLDRSGKSSITKFIHTQLSKQHQTVSISYPNRSTKIGQMINDFLTNKCDIGNEAIHLLFSANRWETIQQVKQILNSGKNIVCDRYWYSGVAYSYAKGLDFQWCIKPDQGLLQPDLVIYLQGDPQILSKRAGYGEERFQRVDFQKKVAQAFGKIFDRFNNKQKLAIVNVEQKDLEQVKCEVSSILRQKL